MIKSNWFEETLIPIMSVPSLHTFNFAFKLVPLPAALECVPPKLIDAGAASAGELL